MRLHVGVISAAVFLLGAIALAQPATQPGENLIRRSSSGTPSATTPASGGGWQVAFSLAAVLGLIVILYWASRRILPNGAFPGTSSRAIHVLGKTYLSPRQKVLVLQVGKRILVVADSAGQLNTLCQITDPDEAAALIGQLGGDQRASVAAFLEKATAPTQPPAPGAAENDELAVTRQELNGLMQQIRTMAQQIGRA